MSNFSNERGSLLPQNCLGLENAASQLLWPSERTSTFSKSTELRCSLGRGIIARTLNVAGIM